MLPGAFIAKKKDGTVYYRSSITYRAKHISLGSFPTEQLAFEAYCVANRILSTDMVFEEQAESEIAPLSFEKYVSLMNYRDHGMYIANPIYLRTNYFSYYLAPGEELKFDIDDLFYYSSHKIMRRLNHYYVNDYGMQVTILGRYGIKNHSVLGRDYYFANQDEMDWRYSNIVVVNRFYGVSAYTKNAKTRYRVKVHINGNYTIGTYSSELKAAVAYNKAVDMAKKAGIDKNFPENYVDEISASEYADLYLKTKISEKYQNYLNSLTNG